MRWNMARLRADGYPAAARALAAGRLDDDAARIACPVHVVVGAEDGITTPDSCRELARAFRPPCAFDEIPGAGHACYVEQPGRFDALAAGFLAA